MKPKLKLNIWRTKAVIFEKKLIPYFKDKKMNEISPADIIKWQNEMIKYRNDGKPYKPTYLKKCSRSFQQYVSDSDKADIFVFDIADVSGSIRLFLDVMKRLGIKLDGDELYEEFQRIYDESVGRDAGNDKAEDKMWNRGRGR